MELSVGVIGKQSEHILYTDFSCKTKLANLDLKAISLFSPNCDDGQLYSAKISKGFEIGKVGGVKIWATPSVEGFTTNNFYDDINGLRAITNGVVLKFEKCLLTVELFANHLDGIKESRDFDNFGASVGYSFSRPLANCTCLLFRRHILLDGKNFRHFEKRT